MVYLLRSFLFILRNLSTSFSKKYKKIVFSSHLLSHLGPFGLYSEAFPFPCFSVTIHTMSFAFLVFALEPSVENNDTTSVYARDPPCNECIRLFLQIIIRYWGSIWNPDIKRGLRWGINFKLHCMSSWKVYYHIYLACAFQLCRKELCIQVSFTSQFYAGGTGATWLFHFMPQRAQWSMR